MTIATTRYAASYVEGTDDSEMQRRAGLLQQRLAEDQDYAEAESARRERISDDPSLPEWLKDVYLDQTILDNDQLRVFFGGVSIQKIWDLSAPLQHKRRPRPHPRMTPEPDVTLKVIGGRPSPGIQLGKAAEWWVASHRGLIDAVHEQLVPNESPQRHGRARGPETIDSSWFVEYANEIASVQRQVPDWVDSPMSTTITALVNLGFDQEIARRVSRCLRVRRSQALEDRRSASKKRS